MGRRARRECPSVSQAGSGRTALRSLEASRTLSALSFVKPGCANAAHYALIRAVMVNPATESLLIEGAALVTPSGTKRGLGLLVEDARIKRILAPDERERPRASKILSLNNHTLFPGFIDIHNHGALGVDVLTAESSDIHRVA